MDKVVHFEIPVDDVERARGFYGSVFEWGIVPMDDAEYTLVFTTPVDEKAQGPIANGPLTPLACESPSLALSRGVKAVHPAYPKAAACGTPQ